MKKRLSMVLTLVLCAVLVFAFSAIALAEDAESEPVVALGGSFDIYSRCYGYGEEVYAVEIETAAALNAETVTADDFGVSFVSRNFCGNLQTTRRTVDSVKVDGTKLTLNLVMTGNGTNDAIDMSNFLVDIVGKVSDTTGKEYNASDFTAGKQINAELDAMLEGGTEHVNYRLFVPAGEPESAPLYIWLHGAGEFGDNNRTQVSCSNLLDWTKPAVQNIFGSKGLYVLAIQSKNSPHNPEWVKEAIDEVVANYNIDVNRIYIAGCSMGGMGTNDMIRTYPDFFAAAMPNCPASVIGPEDAAKLVDLPIIYVHAANDTTVALSNSIQSYNNIKAAGSDNIWCNFFSVNPNNPFTGRGYMGHWSWTWIHNNYTTREAEFLTTGVYTNNDTEYEYVSTPLAEIGNGYGSIAAWLADQAKGETVEGSFTVNTKSNAYGEEPESVTITTDVALDPASVKAEDFTVSVVSNNRTANRAVESVEVDGNTVTLNLVLTGNGLNGSMPITAATVTFRGNVVVDGATYTKSDFEFEGQVNPDLDKFAEFGSYSHVKARLFVPEGAPEGAPLYIWLHGAGEFGTDNRKQVTCSNLHNWTEPEVQSIFGDKGLYILAPQTDRGGHKPAQIMEVILDVCNTYNIDMSRVYIAGCSMGGAGTNNTIIAYPNFFAAAIPNCAASTISASAAETLTDLPILFVHALNDTSVRPSNTINSYNNLKAAGSEKTWINFFEINPSNPISGNPYMGHWSWVWIHNNFTTTEEQFKSGEGVYSFRNVDYPYVSTPLSEIGAGYPNVASWLADQKKENVVYTENVTAQQGEEIRIPVALAGNNGISSVTVQLDCAQVTIKAVEEGEAAVRTDALEVNPANNKVIWTGKADDGVLFYIVAQVADPTPDGTYPINAEILAATGDDTLATAATYSAGSLIIVNPHPKGDVNLDGSVTNADLIMIARYLVDLVQFNEEQLDKADYNDDGFINNTDLVQIARALVQG